MLTEKERIAALEAGEANNIRWQKAQNGSIQEIRKRVDRILLGQFGIFGGIVAAIGAIILKP